MDAWNHNHAWKRRPQLKKLQHKSDQDWMHNNEEKRHMKANTISAQDYLRNDMSKDKLNLALVPPSPIWTTPSSPLTKQGGKHLYFSYW